VEFPVAVKGLFRPHYVTWSEQLRIESHGPDYLANIVRIITETGLRIYKELMPMRKENVDLANAVVWIPDSKTPNGIAEVPLTPLAIQAFQRQMAISGDGPFLFPSERNSTGTTRTCGELGKGHWLAPKYPTSESTISAQPMPHD
jgi:integrase